MQSVMIVVLGIAGMSFGWFVYSKFIATKIYQLDPDFVTPAHEFNDGVDFHPTNKYILWGHHFTSVAGAAPIVGPAIAVYWGWVPAVLWVTIGTIFFAGVHDFGALWASARHKGRSIGALSEEVIGKRTRALFMVVIFLVLLMVNAVFGVVIAAAFVNTPGSVFPAWSAIFVALIIGQLVHRKFNLVVLSLGGVIALYLSVFAGSVMPLELPGELFGLNLCRHRIDAAGLGSLAAPGLHQWHATFRRIDSALRRRSVVATRHIGARIQSADGCGCPIPGAAVIRDDRLWCRVRFSWHRCVRNQLKTTE
jgi:carbon starvation protein